jgi:chromosomal replication initiation ATPase DnaA
VVSQLVLPLGSAPSFGRADFVVAPGNAQAVAFIDSWPHWPVAVAALFGPAGSGKTHLATIWHAMSGAPILQAGRLRDEAVPPGPVIVEDMEQAPPDAARDGRLFALIERATPEAPLLLTGTEPPAQWATDLPDLKSRFEALLALPLWEPDDALLAALARKLFDDRQLVVPSAVIERIVLSLDRTPGAIREFVARADARALSEAKPVSLALVRSLLAQSGDGLS